MIGILCAALLQAGAPRLPVVRAPDWVTQGPIGGWIQVLVVDPRDPATLYASTAKGLFRTTDTGEHWTRLPVPIDDVYGVTVAPGDSSVLYAATISPPVPGEEDAVHDLYRSRDAGATWTRLDERSGFLFNYSVAVDPTDARTIYVNAAGFQGMSRSTDGGDTWTPLPLAPRVGIVTIDPLVATTLYVSGGDFSGRSGVFRSSDAGSSWAATGLEITSFLRFLSVDPLDHETLYAGGVDGFFVSHDGGVTWIPGSGLPPESQVLSFALGRGASPRLYVGASIPFEGLFTSADGGATWSRAGALRASIDALGVGTLGGSDAIFAGTEDRGVLVSTDVGASWTAKNPSILEVPVGALAVASADPRRVYALAGGFARSDDGGVRWSVDPDAPTAIYGALAVDPTDAEVVYASSATAGVLRSADGGVTWTPTFPTAHAVTSIAIDPQTPSTLYMADGWPLKSTDSGGTWRVINSGIAPGVHLIAVDPHEASTLYAAGDGGVYRSDDAGMSWSLLLAQFAMALAPDALHAGTVYVGTDDGVERSADRGATWSLSAPDPYYPRVSAIAVDGNGAVYASAYGQDLKYFPGSSPHRSLDGGRTWEPIGGWQGALFPGFPRSSGALAVTPSGSALYVGTDSESVWRHDLVRTRSVPAR